MRHVWWVTQAGVSYHVAAGGCDAGLGLGDGRVGDSQLSSSLPGSNPAQARLNNPAGAWCFHWSKLQGTEDPWLQVRRNNACSRKG